MEIFKTDKLDILKKVLDCSTARNRAIANNLANIDTPGFQRSDVRFVDHLREAISSGNPEQVAAVEPELYNTNFTPTRNDGNNVDIDVEMGEMAKNGMLFKTFSTLLAAKYQRLRDAIQSSH